MEGKACMKCKSPVKPANHEISCRLLKPGQKSSWVLMSLTIKALDVRKLTYSLSMSGHDITLSSVHLSNKVLQPHVHYTKEGEDQRYKLDTCECIGIL